MRRTLVLSIVLLSSLAGCGGRELGWLVPRASVSLVLRASDSGNSTAAYVSLAAPLSGPQPRAIRQPRSRPAMHLLGPGPRCRLAPLCRWESAARTEAITELTEEESP